MEFKSYCLVVLGRVEGVKDEIGKISETAVRYVDAKGIVIAGVGDGNMNAATLEAAKKAAKNGITVVRATRVPIGAVLAKASPDTAATTCPASY